MTCMNNTGNCLSGQSAALFLTMMNSVYSTSCTLDTRSIYPSDYSSHLRENSSFDFIVVGSGTAGSVVASRLSENPNWSVLLIEAGNYPSVNTEVPNIFFSVQRTPEDWAYEVEPDPRSCLGYKNGRCRWARGRVLGGSSAINAMLYVRGNPEDYERWKAQGNPEWGFENILEAFRKTENTNSVLYKKNQGYHGIGGPVDVSLLPSPSPLRGAMFGAAREMGQKVNDDEQNLGYYECQNFIAKGQRVSASKAYVTKAKGRYNFYLALNTHVTKVNIDHETLEANSITVKVHGKFIRLKAKKEIILSTGSINTPQILMLSGVGPRKHLAKYKIPLVRNLPVGYNLQDHQMMWGLYVKYHRPVTNLSPVEVQQIVYDYFSKREGLLGTVNLLNLIGKINTRNNTKVSNILIHNIFLGSYETGSFKNLLEVIGLDQEVVDYSVKTIGKHDVHLFLPYVTNPKSRGRVMLNSSNPFDKPKIYSGYLSDKNDEDIQLLLESIRYLQKFLKTKAMSAYQPELLLVPVKDCTTKYKLDSDGYWKCYLRHTMNTVYHQTCTCPMGPIDDSKSVVDSRLRVHGIKNLRVVDGSVLPEITSGNPSAPILAIGEIASELIKEDHTSSKSHSKRKSKTQKKYQKNRLSKTFL